MQTYPYLIQRIETFRPNENGTGVDHYFRFDYMGAAEFEYGALPKAMRAMREHVDASVPWTPTRITVGEHTCWYVGAANTEAMAREMFADQLGDRKMRFKESTWISNTYIEKGKYCQAIGWWALDPYNEDGTEACPFVLFKEKDHAKKWLACIRMPKEDKKS